MICKKDDLCFIKKSLRLSNIGLVVTCKEYIGYYLQGDTIDIHGERWLAPVSDNYWLIYSSSSSIETQYGKSAEAYIADLWLTPIKADGLLDEIKTKKEDTIKV